MSYYLQDNPNRNFAQFGWPRTKVSGVIGVHTAENNTDFDGADPGAEDVASWISRRTNPGSYHAIADADSRIKLVHPRYAAWADTTNNPHAMSVSGAIKAARWRELTPERAAAITRNMAYAAAELVQDAIAAGLLASPTPARRITPAEAIAGSKAGFYGHGETNPGRRYDPGQNFDWNLFLTTYAAAIGGLAAAGSITPQGNTNASEEDDMPSLEEIFDYPIARRGGSLGGETTLRSVLAYFDANVEGTRNIVKESAGAAVSAIFSTEFARQGGPGGLTNLAAVIAYLDANLDKMDAEQIIDPEAVKAAVGAATSAALKDISITLSTDGK